MMDYTDAKNLILVDFEKRHIELIPYKSGWSNGLSWDDWRALSLIFNAQQTLGTDQYRRINDMLKSKLAETSNDGGQ